MTGPGPETRPKGRLLVVTTSAALLALLVATWLAFRFSAVPIAPDGPPRDPARDTTLTRTAPALSLSGPSVVSGTAESSVPISATKGG